LIWILAVVGVVVMLVLGVVGYLEGEHRRIESDPEVQARREAWRAEEERKRAWRERAKRR
jgi:hypothetical protein